MIFLAELRAKASGKRQKLDFPPFLIDIQYGRSCSSDLQEEKGK